MFVAFFGGGCRLDARLRWSLIDAASASWRNGTGRRLDVLRAMISACRNR
jgi:hypothetical protein